jgi:hypothetical protein
MGSLTLAQQIEKENNVWCDDCGGPRTKDARRGSKEAGRCLHCYRDLMRYGIKPRTQSAPATCADCGSSLTRKSRRRPTKRCKSCAKRRYWQLKAVRAQGTKRVQINEQDRYVGHGVKPAEGALFRAWLAFKIAKRNGDTEKMKEYSVYINRLENETGRDETTFYF